MNKILYNLYRLRYRLRDWRHSLTIYEKTSILLSVFIIIMTLSFYGQTLELSKQNRDLSKNALCIQKDFNYKDIAPPTITVFLKNPPVTNTPISNSTTLIFIFHIIPNSKTFFYPDAGLDITNTNGFSNEITMKNPLSLCSPCDFYIEVNGGLEFIQPPKKLTTPDSVVWLPYDYRNETMFYKIYNITIHKDANSNISFSHLPPDTFANVNFSFKIKDAYGNKYNRTVLYNISIPGNNIESIRQTKVFEFQRPENYSCY